MWAEFGEIQIENYEKIKSLEHELLFPNQSPILKRKLNSKQNGSNLQIDDFLRINKKSPMAQKKSILKKKKT